MPGMDGIEITDGKLKLGRDGIDMGRKKSFSPGSVCSGSICIALSCFNIIILNYKQMDEIYLSSWLSICVKEGHQMGPRSYRRRPDEPLLVGMAHK